MTFIPDTRKRYKEQLFSGTKGASGEKELNPYYQGYLNNEGKTSISGYDWAVDHVECFFSNIGDYIDFECEDDITEQDILDFINSEKEIDEYDEDDIAQYSSTVINLKIAKEQLLQWLETYRDETIVSLIENMDEEEYQKIKEEVDGRRTEGD